MNTTEIKARIEQIGKVALSKYEDEWFMDDYDTLVDILNLLDTGEDFEQVLELINADPNQFGQRTYYDRFDSTEELLERFDRDWFEFNDLNDVYTIELDNGKDKEKARDYIVNRLFVEHCINSGCNSLFEAKDGRIYYIYFT